MYVLTHSDHTLNDLYSEMKDDKVLSLVVCRSYMHIPRNPRDNYITILVLVPQVPDRLHRQHYLCIGEDVKLATVTV